MKKKFEKLLDGKNYITPTRVPYEHNPIDDDELREAIRLNNRIDQMREDREMDNYRRNLPEMSIADRFRAALRHPEHDVYTEGLKNSKTMKEFEERKEQRRFENELANRYKDDTLYNSNVGDLREYPQFDSYDFEKGQFDRNKIGISPTSYSLRNTYDRLRKKLKE